MESSKGFSVMSKEIVLEGRNGTRSILASRQKTNQSNLEEDMAVWQMIANNNLVVEKTYNKKQEIVWKCKDTQLTTQKRNVVADRMNTIFSRIVKNAQYRGFNTEEDIQISDISRMAQTYLDADPWLQIDYCRDATRQSLDEEVQTKLLDTFVGKFSNITNGKEVPYKGRIVSKKEAKELNGKQIKARSIDAIGKVGNFDVKVFQKTAQVSGSGQSHQTLEAQNWIDEVKLIKDPTLLFVVQMDGPEAETHIEALTTLISTFDNIFVGNSEQVIDWLNSKK
jgi:hypothetical protein